MDPRFILFYVGGKTAAFFIAMFCYCAYEIRKEKKKKKKENRSGKDN